MITYSATEAKQNFAAMLDAAAREPVVIRRRDRDVAMVISPEQYRKLHRLNVEEVLRLADDIGAEAEKNGMTDEILARILASDD
jgi:prevent-host-death family protein